MFGTAAITIGQLELVSMDEAPGDAYIATAAAIGAPAGTTEWQMESGSGSGVRTTRFLRAAPSV